MALCGPKLAICGMVTSVWGVVMLLLIGVFLRFSHSPAFAEDLAIDEAKFDKDGMPYVYTVYNQAGNNCFIAAGLYVVLFAFSFVQHKINARANYVMS